MSNMGISESEARAEFRLAWERSGSDWDDYAEGVFSTWWRRGTSARAEAASQSAALSSKDYAAARNTANLRLADVGRLKGSDVRNQLMKREITPAEALTSGRADSLRVYKFLLAIHKIGENRVNKICSQMPISPIRRIDTLTDRQKKRLAELIEKI